MDSILFADYLVHQQDGYSYYQLPVNPATNKQALYLRNLHKQRLHSAGYAGYSDDIDQEYHAQGTYFCAVYGNIIATTMRANLRTSRNRFPFEMGLKADGTQHAFNQQYDAIDLNTYSLDRDYYKQATPVLFHLAAKFAIANNAKRVYGMADTSNGAIMRIYQGLRFGFSEDFAEPITFDSFVYEKDQKPVPWHIMEWKEGDITLAASAPDWLTLQ
ncbi:MAG: hypothetical protein MI750_12325 [Xanthomonadales bacterium]|nr:hypothetical protein [Xanthomonadales bacterium]